MLQNGFASALPYMLDVFVALVCGQIADFLRRGERMRTGVVRKIFATVSKFWLIRETSEFYKEFSIESLVKVPSSSLSKVRPKNKCILTHFAYWCQTYVLILYNLRCVKFLNSRNKSTTSIHYINIYKQEYICIYKLSIFSRNANNFDPRMI